jgi:hypothetical protein
MTKSPSVISSDEFALEHVSHRGRARPFEAMGAGKQQQLHWHNNSRTNAVRTLPPTTALNATMRYVGQLAMCPISSSRLPSSELLSSVETEPLPVLSDGKSDAGRWGPVNPCANGLPGQDARVVSYAIAPDATYVRVTLCPSRALGVETLSV